VGIDFTTTSESLPVAKSLSIDRRTVRLDTD